MTVPESNGSPPIPRVSRPSSKMWWTVTCVVVLGASAWFGWSAWLKPSARAARAMERAKLARQIGDFQKSAEEAAAALSLDPTLNEAAMLAAECCAELQKFQQAITYLQRLNSTGKETRIRCGLWKGEWNLHGLRRLSAAVKAYREVLAVDADNITANRELARILGMSAQRRAAIPHVLRLIRQNQETDLLILLMRDNGVLNEREFLAQAHRDTPEDPAPMIGLAWHASEADDHGAAISLLKKALEVHPHHAAASAALGQQWIRSSRFLELREWHRRLTEAEKVLPETWVVCGELAEHFGHSRAAIRCYLEASFRAPELRKPASRLAKLLAEDGEHRTAKMFAAHFRLLLKLADTQSRFLQKPRHDSVEPALELARAFEKVGRLWEAYAWTLLAARVDPYHSIAAKQLQQLEQKVNGIPLKLTVDASNIARTIDLSSYPLPVFRSREQEVPATGTRSGSAIAFRDDAARLNVEFQYFSGTSGPLTQRMYELTGGGVASLDYDGDGWPDLCFTQGCVWPPDPARVRHTDRLFRNLSGDQFEDVSSEARIIDGDFGQGVAVGDFNSDGFPDLFVANAGSNRLWQNAGDGTFHEVSASSGIRGDQWTTSCVLADLTGDGHPDIYEVNYLAGEEVFEKVCQHPDGSPRQCVPIHFDGAADRLWVSNGAGQFHDRTRELCAGDVNGKGLGVAVWSAAASKGLDLLVANDTTPNLFFQRDSDSNSNGLAERGVSAGIAVNEDGKAEGCMGIALGDADGDGDIDVFVTNFYNESNTLYVNAGDDFFEDRTKAFGLDTASVKQLGFGTQFLDADLDGTLELFVANGHVDDLRKQGRPWKMKPQLFQQSSAGRFSLVDAESIGRYFQQKWLGRAVARCDWNRDGKEDLVVGHLVDASSLLTNVTETNNRFLSLRLIGVKSARDAIGTTVEARIGSRTIIRQLTAGDGYQASNDRRLIFGTGEADVVDRLTVRWPSGLVQDFEEVTTRQEFWLIEGRLLVTNTP